MPRASLFMLSCFSSDLPSSLTLTSFILMASLSAICLCLLSAVNAPGPSFQHYPPPHPTHFHQSVPTWSPCYQGPICFSTSNSILPLKKNFFNVYLFLRRERQSMSRGGERKRETWNLKQAPGSKLSAQSPTRGSNLQTARS